MTNTARRRGLGSLRPRPSTVEPHGLVADLRTCVAGPDQVSDRELDRYARSHDASHFLLRPAAVVVARDAREVGALLAASARQGVPLTFRSGGTSLSGQALTDGVLVDVRRHFREVEVLDDGARVRVQPGVTVAQLNARLAPYGTRFGPDPASETACTIGGALANNSSGMACGTTENSYRTLESVVAVLPSGTVLDTGARDADERLRHLEPDLYAGLLALRDRVRSNPASVATIGAQYAMKNTMGYGVNTLLDHDAPAAILTHLLVGSEGTLGFVAQATFATVPTRPHRATALLLFTDLYAANHALPALVETRAATLELMDATSLRVGQGFADCPEPIRALRVDQQAALLVEYQATAADDLGALVEAAAPELARLPTLDPAALSRDPAPAARAWKLRKGLYTAVAGARPSGSTALLEDIAVPVDALAPTCAELTGLFERHGYPDGVIFGHAKDGNVHFMLTDRFESADQLGRYAAFTEDLVELVLGRGGTLKAEHGTGRVMAPYVRRQFGDELYAVMGEVKRLCDPAGLLNPGVVLSDDPEVHLKHIKLAPSVEPEVDRCTECGYCEPVCPSKDLTMTPRQRIAVRRDLVAAYAAGDTGLVDRLSADYDYDGVQTCAVDGMCQTACPVLINTGDLVKRLRRDDQPRPLAVAWTQAARHWSGFTRAGSTALTVADRLPGPARPVAVALNELARRAVGADRVPRWSPELPAGGARRCRPAPAVEPDAVYLPSCVGALFGPAQDESPESVAGVQVAFERLCAQVGITLFVPDGIDALCCGTPWSSKGLPNGRQAMADRVRPVVVAASRGGVLPVVTDASSCTQGFGALLADDENGSGVPVVDVVTFVADRVLPRLGERHRLDSVWLHPTCSSTQLGLNEALTQIAEAVAHRVHTPAEWMCCAFAGDRGLLHPELTASATGREAAEVEGTEATAYASVNRTCELGLTRATGRPYRHVVELLAEVSALA